MQARKRNPTPNFLVRISSGGVGGLPRGGVGAIKFGMSFETEGNQTFWRDAPGVKSLRKVCVDFSFPARMHTPGVCLREYRNFRFKIGQYFEFSQFMSLGWCSLE